MIIICLHTIIWSQVLLFDKDNYQNLCIWHYDGTLKGSLGYCEGGGNGKEEVVCSPPDLQNWSLSDVV